MLGRQKKIKNKKMNIKGKIREKRNRGVIFFVCLCLHMSDSSHIYIFFSFSLIMTHEKSVTGIITLGRI